MNAYDVAVLTSRREDLLLASPRDHIGISELLAEPLIRLYPGGQEWLRQRLATLPETGRATVVRTGADVVAVAIETWKPAGRVKLSTFYVGPVSRGRGLGTALATHLVDRWTTERWAEAYVTVASSAVEGLSRLLVPLGFLPWAVELDRYGVGRHEHVLNWVGPSEVRAYISSRCSASSSSTRR